jgi:hypothetical protein
LAGTDLKRKISHYYLTGTPDVWVYYDTPDAVSQDDEDSTISQYITGLALWGEKVINISLNAQTDSQTINLKTSVWIRNI